MTKAEVPKMLKEMKVPFAYDHFAEGEAVEPPFLLYLFIFLNIPGIFLDEDSLIDWLL